MHFRAVYTFFFYILLLLLAGCSNTEDEEDLVNLFAVASLDLVAINFPADSETLVSTDTFVDYRLEGTKSDGTSNVPITKNISWSVSSGAASSINSNGRLTTGSAGEVITLTARVGYLTASLEVTVSDARFDRVVQLSSQPVELNRCQSARLYPVGRYVRDDGTEEIRAVDNTIINTITWLVFNAEDSSPSQRARVRTENSIATLQAFASGNIILRAQAYSPYNDSIVTSGDFSQTLDNNLINLKLCRQSDTSLVSCTLGNPDLGENQTLAVVSLAEYRDSSGASNWENISALSKWGIDNPSYAEISLSADRSWLNIKALQAGTSPTVSVACGTIEQSITDSQLEEGVVLTEAVSCASGSTDCDADSSQITIGNSVSLSSLSVTANGLALQDNVELGINDTTVILRVTAHYSDGSSKDVTTDTETLYNRRNNVLTEDTDQSGQVIPGQYIADQSPGTAEIQITYQGQTFTALMAIPF
ncbi:MAG TPA: hypothetical protein ENJ11_10020 [Gammaproteobacteria bacterium]|nr:hypothetical protein [Gammaproteobacteria bacterium]